MTKEYLQNERQRREERYKLGYHRGVKTGALMTFFVCLIIASIFMVWHFVDRVDNYAFSDTTIHIVQTGDTLWHIAQQHSDNRHDIRKVVHIIRELNDITPLIHSGQRIEIPLFDILQNTTDK